MIQMFGLSLWQPHASLIVVAAINPPLGKHVETRHWSPLKKLPPLPVRLAIHAAQKFPMGEQWACCYGPHHVAAMRALGIEPTKAGLKKLPRKAFVAVADLVAVKPVPDSPSGYADDERHRPPLPRSAEYTFGNYGPGRFMWFLDNIRALREPLPANGRQGFWPLTAETVANIEGRIR